MATGTDLQYSPSRQPLSVTLAARWRTLVSTIGSDAVNKVRLKKFVIHVYIFIVSLPSYSLKYEIKNSATFWFLLQSAVNVLFAGFNSLLHRGISSQNQQQSCQYVCVCLSRRR